MIPQYVQGWTLTYAAPEVLQRRGAGLPSDIYSFGVMIWQVNAPAHYKCRYTVHASARMLHAVHTFCPHAIAWQVLSGRSPSPYAPCTVESRWRIAPLLRNLLNENPTARPTALQLKEGLAVP